jgi:hypothetical protein
MIYPKFEIGTNGLATGVETTATFRSSSLGLMQSTYVYTLQVIGGVALLRLRYLLLNYNISSSPFQLNIHFDEKLECCWYEFYKGGSGFWHG